MLNSEMQLNALLGLSSAELFGYKTVSNHEELSAIASTQYLNKVRVLLSSGVETEMNARFFGLHLTARAVLSPQARHGGYPSGQGHGRAGAAAGTGGEQGDQAQGLLQTQHQR
jgi:hypothetical protein